ncbi:MAG: hypothetical protein ACE5PV_27585 [Candidatus Poribacteria bacterium]
MQTERPIESQPSSQSEIIETIVKKVILEGLAPIQKELEELNQRLANLENENQKIAKQSQAVTNLFIRELEGYGKLQGIYVSLDKSFYHIIFDVLDDDETTLRRIVEIDTEARIIAPDLSIDLLFCDFNADPDLREATLIDHEQML